MAHIVGGLAHVICVAKIVKYMHCVRKSIYNPPFIYLKRTVNQPFLELSHLSLTLSRRRPLSYRNQSIDLLCKSLDWFLHNNGLRHERVKDVAKKVNSNDIYFGCLLLDVRTSDQHQLENAKYK